jgi:hypothetical protein
VFDGRTVRTPVEEEYFADVHTVFAGKVQVINDEAILLRR